jgi:hypothetical protein
LELHQHVVRGSPAIDAKLTKWILRICVHCLENVRHLEGDALQRCARYVPDLRAALQADQETARVCIPVRRAEASESGNKDNAVRRIHRLRNLLDIR